MTWAGQTPDEIARQYGFEAELADPWALFGAVDAGVSTLAGLPDFDALVQSDPHFAAAWSDVQAQMTAEGSTDLTGAKIALADSFTQLAGQSFGITLDTSKLGNAYDTAKQYVLVGQTIAGAVNTVSGLIGSIESGAASPVAIMQAFTGTMIGLLAVVGAPTAGIGAVIVGAVFAAIALVESLVGSPAVPVTGYTSCGFILNETPDWTVGCLGAWGAKNSPNATVWRSFPEPGNPADAAWFQAGQVGPGQWTDAFYGARGRGKDQGYGGPNGGVWGPPVNGVNPAGGDESLRPIDNAYPGYFSGGARSVYQQVVELGAGLYTAPIDAHFFGIVAQTGINTSGWDPAILANFAAFTKAYVAAWKANASYPLNGLNAQPDYRVLIHLIRIWNRSHVGGEFSLPPGPPDSSTYIGSLVVAATHANEGADLLNAIGAFSVNLGPQLQPPQVAPGLAPLAAAAGGSTPPADTTTAPPSAAPIVVAGVVTTAALGGLWLLLGQPLSLAALKAAAGEAVHHVARVLRR